jgi:formylglycine-generating enzyme required for sulfatase activity
MKKSLKKLVLFSLLSCFVSFQLSWAQNVTSLDLQITNGEAGLTISGISTNACTVQYATNVTGVNPWHYLTYFQATNDPAFFPDTNQLSANPRFYRVFAQALPGSVVPVTNMIWISPGIFAMGSPTNEAGRGSDETQYSATLTQGFYIGKFLVTQGDYLALMETNPSYYNTNDEDLSLPVEEVSWSDATNYCAQLTQQETTAGKLPAGWAYRLATEAEWEYACRAGTTTAVYYGNQLLSGMANFDGTEEYYSTTGFTNDPSGIYLNQTTTVGNYEPNAWGLFDMCGNVLEWCQDWYGPYPTGSATDPTGATTGSARVLRGGSYVHPGEDCRSAQRFSSGPTTSFANAGFRIVLAPSP